MSQNIQYIRSTHSSQVTVNLNSAPASANPKPIIKMGNVLESDTSTESMEESDTDTSRIVTSNTRTAGDGMECENNCQSKGITNLKESSVLQPQDPESKPKIPIAIPTPIPFPTPLNSIDQQNLIPGIGSVYKSVQEAMKTQLHKVQVSPKNLPPKNKLIMLKPTRRKLGHKHGHVNVADEEYYMHMDSQNLPTPYSQFTSGFPKQRDPKFVPYEPYKGAVRSIMQEESQNSFTVPHGQSLSRRASSSSSSITTARNSPGSTSDHNCNLHSHSNSNLTLVKERLKISEKENSELQKENTRLKRMIVDSLSGDHQVQVPSVKDGNLSDEIEVWRSKFLSSCVLVEQLTKENQALKSKLTQAGELFQDIKHSVQMTPELYEKISGWTRSHQRLASYDSYCNFSPHDHGNPIQ